MTTRTPIASTVPQPHGKPGGPGAFGMKGAQFPPYIQHVAGEMLKKGKTKSQAYRLAVGIVRNWKDGHDGRGNRVSPEVQAAASKAWAAYLALRARAKATPNHEHDHTAARESVDLAKPNLTDRSGMIALEIPDGTLPKMPGGLSNHHVTLAYLGDDVDDAGYAKAIKAAKHAASRHGPLAGQLGGIGAFPPGPDGTPVWATVDVPGLAELRHTLVQHMGGHASEHGFTPHATLSYVKSGEPMPKPLPPTNVKFGHVSVHRGDQVVRIPLAGGSGRKQEHTEGRMTVDLAARYARTRAGEPYVWSGHDGGSLPVDLAKDYVEATRLKDGTPAPPGVMKTRGGHVVKKKPKLGTGARFKALVAKLEARGHSHESAVKIAAAIGRRKYGAKKMGQLSHHHTAVRESVELAARNGRHIPGTDYNWRHGYIPLNAETAARWRKPWHGGGPHPKAKAGTGKAPKTREERAADKLKPGEFAVKRDGPHWVVAGRQANGKPVGYRYRATPHDPDLPNRPDEGKVKAEKMAERLRADHAAAVKPKRQPRPKAPSQGALFGERKVRGKGPKGGEWDVGSTVTFKDSEGNRHTGQVWSPTNKNNEVFVVTPDQRAFRVSTKSGTGEHQAPAKPTRKRDVFADPNGGRERPVQNLTSDRTASGHTFYADGTPVTMKGRKGTTAGMVDAKPYPFQVVKWDDGGQDNVAPQVLAKAEDRPLKPGEYPRQYLRSIGRTSGELGRAAELERAAREAKTPEALDKVAAEFGKIHPRLGEHHRAQAEEWRRSLAATAKLRQAQQTAKSPPKPTGRDTVPESEGERRIREINARIDRMIEDQDRDGLERLMREPGMYNSREEERIHNALLTMPKLTPRQRLRARYEKALKAGDADTLSKIAYQVDSFNPSLAARIRKEAAQIRAKQGGKAS